MHNRQDDDAERVPLRNRPGDSVQVVHGIGTGQTGIITSVHPTQATPSVVNVDDAVIRSTEDRLTALPVDGP